MFMSFRVLLRILVGVAYLGILAAGAAAILGKVSAFEGRVVVAEHRTEACAVRPSSGGIFSLARNMPLDVLPLDNPQAARAALDNKRSYDAAALGMRLRLDGIKALAPAGERDVLEVSRPGSPAVTMDAESGKVLSVPGAAGAWRVRSVEAWAGLLRDASGRRMAAFSFFRKGEKDWTQGLFTEAGQWTMLTPLMALRLDWADSEDAAKAGLPAVRPGLDAARWSVLDKGRVHQFESFVPGTSETLADGTEYVLLSVNEGAWKNPSITVGIRKAGKGRRVEVPANATQPVEGIRFEYPGAMPLLVLVRAWRDGAAWIASFGPEQTFGPARLEEGGEWDATPDLRFRLDQTMSQGIPVGVKGAPVWMASVSTGDGQLLRLREGLAVRHGDISLCYKRVPRPPAVSYAFQALSMSGKTIGTFTLEPGQKHRVQDWVFMQDTDNLKADKTAVLVAERIPSTHYGILGLLLILAGGAGWMATRIRWRRQQEEPAWTDLTLETSDGKGGSPGDAGEAEGNPPTGGAPG